jgi:hypothetical protein
LAVDQNFKITKNDINKILINCQKRTDGFWQLIETFFKAYNTIIRTFDQLPKSVGSFLAVDRMYCWLRNRAKNKP